MNQQTCFVTGAAGFVGSHLVDRLLAAGCQVVGVDNLLLGKTSHLASANENQRFAFKELDVNDPKACIAFIRSALPQGRVQTVWHMAANSDIQAGCKDPDIDVQATFLTTYNVLKIMQELGIPEIAFPSTSAVYGELDCVLREDTGPLFPISNYGAMKLASEGLISAGLERFLERAWIFRFPNVVGPRATHGAIHDFLKKLRQTRSELEVLGDGSQEKPYLHVTELIEAMLHLVQHARDRLNCFNIAPEGPGTTVRYIAEAVVRTAVPGAAIRYTGGAKGWVGDVPHFRYSIDKLKATGWSPRLTSNQAVDRAIQENLQQSDSLSP